jgi:hypothetical protein
MIGVRVVCGRQISLGQCKFMWGTNFVRIVAYEPNSIIVKLSFVIETGYVRPGMWEKFNIVKENGQGKQ